MSPTSAPQRRSDLVVGELNQDQETALLSLASGHVVSLNPTAAAVWYLCDGRRDASAIAQELLDAFPDADPSQVESDVRAILAQLNDLGLFE